MEFLFAQISNLKKNYFLILFFLLLLVINDALILADFYILKNNKAKTVTSKIIDSSSLNDESSNIYVDIKGEVKNPGVYPVNDTMIVNDVIKLAGGLKKNGVTDNINLSKKVFDQMVIIVLSKSQVKKNKTISKNDALITTEEAAIITKSDVRKDEVLENTLININTASLEELMSLSGVGQSRADAIITYRKNNRFEYIEDIKNVAGIGESLFEKIKDSITV